MNFTPIFGSKKATIAIVGAVLTMFVSVLPVFFPVVDPAIFQEGADYIMKILVMYLPSQAVVDVVKVIKQQVNEPITN